MVALAKDFPDPPMIERDGTSQAGRVQPALDPGHVSVDERSALDLLSFSRKYAAELLFHEEPQAPGVPPGTWSAFLEQDLAKLAALVDGPEPLDVEDRRTDRPHLALFLAFLRLHKHPQDLVNTFTRRHLQLYYEQLLRMTRKPAVPDRVHVLLRLAAGVDQAQLPEGTLLRAGKDSQGRERVYRTDQELVVNRAAVARLSSVYAQKEVVGLREARELTRGPREEAFVRMLEIALGEPRPGDPLPKYAGKDVTYPLLLELLDRVDFAEDHLFMDLSDLHSMMTLVRRRAAADGQWKTINLLLEKAGRTRTKLPTWKLNPVDPRDFPQNLIKALGAPLDFAHDGLPQVSSVEDLYKLQLLPERQDVRDFIVAKLFLGLDDFREMMRIKTLIDAEWGEINRILDQAGRRKRNKPSFTLDKLAPPIAPTAFPARLDAAVGPLPWSSLAHAILPAVADEQAYYDAILAIEAYFHMNAAQVGYILSTAQKPADPGASEGEWANVYRLLADAHKEKVYSGRRAALQAAVVGAANRVAGFRAMLRIALGRDADDPHDPAAAELRDFVRPPEDSKFLEAVEQRLGAVSPSADDWARVYRIVELAQRVRERLPEPVAQRETWLDLHAAGDATSVLAAAAGDAGGKVQRWKTFGQKRPESTEGHLPAGAMGWAISSPLLLLAQGKRTVVLTLGFSSKWFDTAVIAGLFPAGPAADQGPFEIEVSTEKGWLRVAAAAAVGDYKTLSGTTRTVEVPLRGVQLTVTLGEEIAAVVAPDREAAGVSTSFPMLRLRLRRIWDADRGQATSRYEAFRDLTLAAVHLKTSVVGLVPSAIQNDDAVLNAKKPFEPFGSSPAVGSRFHIGDPELVQKRLDSLTFRIEWRGAPADIAAHYTNYPSAGPFTAAISLVDSHRRLLLTGSPTSLFASPDATAVREIPIAGIPALLEKPGAAYRYKTLVEAPVGPQVSRWTRYFEWELTPNDFNHQAYPAQATKLALQMASAITAKGVSGSPVDAAAYQIKPPYTPKIKSLTVTYAASTEIVLQDTASALDVDRLFHVHPFGASPIDAEDPSLTGGTRFLPRYDDEGELYIGIRGARPPETLSLLFQMAEGSANPDLLPVPVEWRYLSGDRWLTLHDGHLLSDTTHGLIDSGIVRIALQPAEPSTRLPGDLHWIRASIPYHADSVCDAVGVHAQAVSATFVDRKNAPDHLAAKLPERSITGLVQRVAKIAGADQPYPSRGGRVAEAEGGFYTRVSERLRHKQRALTIWDYERLVLERFPDLYKVKCIPADAARRPESLGAVDLVVIPRVRGQSTANPFEPKAPAALIQEIAAYLDDKRPPQAALRVRNAHFVQVKVRVGVRFKGAGDEGFYKKRLNEELNRHLSPWAYEEGADIVIGGKIFANSIVSFIDSRDYVDYVATIKLFSCEDGRTFKMAQPLPGQGYFVATERPDGVLVAALEHEIDVISDVGYTAESFTGINYMKIELDFVVAGSG